MASFLKKIVRPLAKIAKPLLPVIASFLPAPVAAAVAVAANKLRPVEQALRPLFKEQNLMPSLPQVLQRGGQILRRLPLPGAAGAIAGTAASLFGSGRRARRRRRARFTNKEIQELMIAKMLFGQRSPLITIMGIKMMSRGD